MEVFSAIMTTLCIVAFIGFSIYAMYAECKRSRFRDEAEGMHWKKCEALLEQILRELRRRF